MVNIKHWSLMNIDEISSFFDVDTRYGLGQQSVLARIKKFGFNNDPTVPDDMQKVYKATVLRGSQRQRISIKNIVPGDVVIIKEGSRVPADLRLFKVNNLKIDQSKLTGEALPAAKNTYTLKKEVPLAQQKCIAFMGSFVSSGSGMGVAVRQAHSSAHTQSLPEFNKNVPLFSKLAFKRLRSIGVISSHPENKNLLTGISTLLINMNLTEQDVQNLIIKIQLAKNIDCKLINQNPRSISKDSNVLDLSQLKKIDKQKLLGLIKQAQFIANATSTDVIKLMAMLNNNDCKVMYITEGLAKDEAIKPAEVSLIIGNFARDDNISAADFIAPKQKINILERIL